MTVAQMHSDRIACRLQAATEVRKEVNELDNLTTGKAVDVLLNYETVKLFNNEQHEVDQYDAYLLGFQVSCCAVLCSALLCSAVLLWCELLCYATYFACICDPCYTFAVLR